MNSPCSLWKGDRSLGWFSSLALFFLIFNSRVSEGFLGQGMFFTPLSGENASYTSCLELRNSRPQLTSGTYQITRNGTLLTVYCDMVTDGGGYTFYPIDSGLQTFRATDNNSCKALGMDIVIPRTKAHWEAMLNLYGNQYFSTIPGIYKIGSGGNYTGCVMRSPAHYGSGCSDWRALDGGRWWLRDSTFGEPNGDYTGYCWLTHYWSGSAWYSSDLQFNDLNCTYSTTKYLCSPNDKS